MQFMTGYNSLGALILHSQANARLAEDLPVNVSTDTHYSFNVLLAISITVVCIRRDAHTTLGE